MTRLFVLFALILTGCDDAPEPPVVIPADYVGVWERGRYGKDENYVYLQITADGQLAYARYDHNNGASTCVGIEASQVDAITDTQIETSVLWLFPSDYEIDRPPTVSGDTWRMTIDGRELTRTDSRKGGFDYSWDCDDGLVRQRMR